MSEQAKIKQSCKHIRESILQVSKVSGHGHIPTCFSVVETLYAIYAYMKHDPMQPDWSERDLFVLSKGHAALAMYTTLSHFGYFPQESIHQFGSFGSRFGCHADRLRVPGVEASTGSLGHGIGLAVGMALASRINGTSKQVYTLIGDGEANEGTVWEAVMVAADLKLDNLTIIVDANNSQGRSLQLDSFKDKFNAFAADTYEVDGHNVNELTAAFEQNQDTVKVIVANTVKGQGCELLSNAMYEWHRRSPNESEFELLMEQLNHA